MQTVVELIYFIHFEVMNIIESVKGFLGEHILTGEKLNDPDLSDARLNKCISCIFYNAVTKSCNVCGCIAKIKSKAKTSIDLTVMRYEETHCPKGTWPIRLENKTIGGNDLQITNYYRKLKGKNIINNKLN